MWWKRSTIYTVCKDCEQHFNTYSGMEVSFLTYVFSKIAELNSYLLNYSESCILLHTFISFPYRSHWHLVAGALNFNLKYPLHLNLRSDQYFIGMALSWDATVYKAYNLFYFTFLCIVENSICGGWWVAFRNMKSDNAFWSFNDFNLKTPQNSIYNESVVCQLFRISVVSTFLFLFPLHFSIFIFMSEILA